jgi:general secretion pathway protein I
MNARRSHGFTLIEMVIALAILGLTLSVLYGAFESALSRSRHDARLSEGTLIAQSLLARAGTEWPLTDGTTRGEWNAYTYELTQQTVSPPLGQPVYTQPTVRVTASVNWTEFAGHRDVTLSTLKLAPRIIP